MAIEFKKRMTDQEYRLFDMYVVLARWDKRDKERFGIVEDVSIRDLQSECLPDWSVGKISATRTSLAEKGLLTKLPKNKTGVNNFWIYQASIRQAEQGFRDMEQQVKPTEQSIHQIEQQDATQLKTKIKDIADKYRVIGL